MKTVRVPTPVDEWLGDLDFQDNNWDVDENKFSYQFDKNDWSSILNEDLLQEFEWDNNGEFLSYREYGSGDLMYKLRLQGLFSSIPGYEIPLLLGMAGADAIGIIYIITRKNK